MFLLSLYCFEFYVKTYISLYSLVVKITFIRGKIYIQFAKRTFKVRLVQRRGGEGRVLMEGLPNLKDAHFCKK